MTSANTRAIPLTVGKAIQVFVISVGVTYGSLGGQWLATDPALATLPITIMIMVAGVTTLPVAALLRSAGRASGFAAGAACGSVGAAVAAWALLKSSFVLFCIGCGMIGLYHTTVEYYRYAAADIAGEGNQERAISEVLAGGTAGALVGPLLAIWSQGWFAVPFIGPFVAVAIVLALLMPALALLGMPRVLSSAQVKRPERSLLSVVSNPAFLFGVGLSAGAWSVMAFLMTGAPLAIVQCGMSSNMAALGIQGHLLAMFGPSFVTGYLSRKFGVKAIFVSGCLALTACVVVMSVGSSFWNFLAGLVLLGFGWNFLYFISTVILVRLPVQDRATAQGLNEQVSWIASSGAAGLAGFTFFQAGWLALLLLSLAPIIAVGLVGMHPVVRSRPSV